MSIYSLLTSGSGNRIFEARQELVDLLNDNVISALEDKCSHLHEERAILSAEIINTIVREYYKSIFVESVEEKLNNIFASPLHELITTGRDKIVFEIETDFGKTKMGYYKGWGELRVEKFPTFDNEIKLRVKAIEDYNNFTPVEKEDGICIFNLPSQSFRRGEEGVVNTIESISVCLEKLNFKNPFDDSFYLPASRAGFLESHDILSAGAFNTLSRAGIEPIEVPAFSGAVSSYLSEVSNISQSDDMTELSDLAQEFEKDALGGHIKVEQSENEPQPDITFSQYDRDFPFHLTSTGIAEIAPLTLFTKYKLDPGSTVVIEEPEAHLHPENQRKIAEYITRLVNNNIRVIVTTHSDFFIEQLNNLIRLSGVSEETRESADLGNKPTLSPNDISINMFYAEEGPEYTAEELEVDQIDGVPMDQFERVGDELYGQAHKVDTLLQKEYN